MFLPTGELIDESGRVYKGLAEIELLLNGLFEQFPGIQVSLNPESIRPFGPAIIEEGTRQHSAGDGTMSATFRYIDLWVKTDSGWKLASHREFAEDPAPTPNDYLQPISWIVGDWLSEGVDATVSIRIRWSDDENFLLGEYVSVTAAGEKRKSTQRIGWDRRSRHIRSWLFDDDGGFSEGVWSVIANDRIVIKSTSVNPDGTDASVTLNLTRLDEDHFTFAGTERIIGGNREPDFELTIARSPPKTTAQ
jgi:hypothetical protein